MRFSFYDGYSKGHMTWSRNPGAGLRSIGEPGFFERVTGVKLRGFREGISKVGF
jgi:hypothetical protein